MTPGDDDVGRGRASNRLVRAGAGVKARFVTAVPGMARNAPRRNVIVAYGYSFGVGVLLALLQ